MADSYRLDHIKWEPVVRHDPNALLFKWKWNVKITFEYQMIDNRVMFLFKQDKSTLKKSTAVRRADWRAKYECESRFERRQRRVKQERRFDG